MSSFVEKKWIQNIHVAKAKTNISDEEYRAILNGAAGIESTKEIKTWKEYDSIMKAFQSFGFKLERKSIQKTEIEKRSLTSSFKKKKKKCAIDNTT